MSGRRLHQSTIIQAEQVQLRKIEKQVESMLGLMKEALNELKVEELQLKSSQVASMKIQEGNNPCHGDEQPGTSAKVMDVALPLREEGDGQPEHKMKLMEARVNQQEIDLNLDLLVPLHRQKGVAEEEEEDDSD